MHSSQGLLHNTGLIKLRLVCVVQLPQTFGLKQLLLSGSNEVDGLSDVGEVLFAFSEALRGMVGIAEHLEHVVSSERFLALSVICSGTHSAAMSYGAHLNPMEPSGISVDKSVDLAHLV